MNQLNEHLKCAVKYAVLYIAVDTKMSENIDSNLLQFWTKGKLRVLPD